MPGFRRRILPRSRSVRYSTPGHCAAFALTRSLRPEGQTNRSIKERENHDWHRHLGTIEHVDPNSIEVEVNVRTVVAVDPTLIASIREYDVLEPVVCRRADSGLTVRMGRRRVLAAREAGRQTIPAYVVEGDDSTVTRLIERFAENEHRANLTAPERAAVFQQLAFEGLSVTKIARVTGV